MQQMDNLNAYLFDTQVIKLRRYGEMAVAYNRRSAETHHLDAHSMAVLACMGHQAQTLEQIQSLLRPHAFDDCCVDRVLEQLVSRELVSRL